MNKLEKRSTVEAEVKTGRLEDACARYGLGRTTMRKLAEDTGAVIHVGKCYLVNYSIVDDWMNSNSGNSENQKEV